MQRGVIEVGWTNYIKLQQLQKEREYISKNKSSPLLTTMSPTGNTTTTTAAGEVGETTW
jgi:hypothetical protein